MKPEEYGRPDGHQRRKETIAICDQRSNDDDLGMRSWYNDPRRSNRIAQRPHKPNCEGMMNLNLLFTIRNCDDATKVEGTMLFQSMV